MTIKDVTNFVVGNYNYYVDRHNMPNHIREQILFRMLKCAKCTYRGKCVHCGCTTPNMFFSSTKVDSEENWPSEFILDKEKWEAYKASLDPSISELSAAHPDIVLKWNNL